MSEKVKSKKSISSKANEDIKVKIEDAVLADAENPEIEAVRKSVEAASVEPDTTERVSISDSVKGLSPGALVLKRFFRSKLSIVGLVIIVFLFLLSFIGPLFSPWGEVDIDYDNSAGRGAISERLETFVAPDGTEYQIYDIVFTRYGNNIYAPISWKHLLGTDESGRDIFTRMMYGGRTSLLLGFMVVFSSTLVGVLLGGVAGYYGKWVDQIIMRIVDIFNCIPTLPVMLIAASLLDMLGVQPQHRLYWVLLILTIFNWAGTARMVRGQILSLREQEYMVAAEAMGVSSARKIFRHLIPNVMPQLIVSMTLSLGGVIIMEATLSYLGLGVQAPYAAWGTMINAAKAPEILSNYFNMWGPPGICIILAVLGFNFVGDGLRDAFDPRMKR